MPTPDEVNRLCDWVATQDFDDQTPDNLKAASLVKKGGQGAVFSGTYAGDTTAIKVYYPGQLDKRVEREIEALSSLDCSTIVRLYWSGTIDYEGEIIPVTATEFIAGSDLRDVIDAAALSEAEVGKLVYDVAAAIKALWDSGKRIVHRDLKPDNIMVRGDGRYCVIDLGVARHIDEPTLTATGSTWGTVGYFSPEQAKARKALTSKSDVFALGIIAVEAALGRHPTRRDQRRVFSSGMDQQLPGLADSFSFAPLIRRMLSASPLKRPSPQEIMDALDGYAP